MLENLDEMQQKFLNNAMDALKQNRSSEKGLERVFASNIKQINREKDAEKRNALKEAYLSEFIAEFSDPESNQEKIINFAYSKFVFGANDLKKSGANFSEEFTEVLQEQLEDKDRIKKVALGKDPKLLEVIARNTSVGAFNDIELPKSRTHNRTVMSSIVDAKKSGVYGVLNRIEAQKFNDPVNKLPDVDALVPNTATPNLLQRVVGNPKPKTITQTIRDKVKDPNDRISSYKMLQGEDNSSLRAPSGYAPLRVFGIRQNKTITQEVLQFAEKKKDAEGKDRYGDVRDVLKNIQPSMSDFAKVRDKLWTDEKKAEILGLERGVKQISQLSEKGQTLDESMRSIQKTAVSMVGGLPFDVARSRIQSNRVDFCVAATEGLNGAARAILKSQESVASNRLTFDPKGRNAVQFLIEEGKLESPEILQDIMRANPEQVLKNRDKSGRNAMHYILSKGEVEMINRVSKGMLESDSRFANSRSAVAQELLNNAKRPDRSGRTALESLVINNPDNVIPLMQEMRKMGAKVHDFVVQDSKGDLDILGLAIKSGNVELVDNLLKNDKAALKLAQTTPSITVGMASSRPFSNLARFADKHSTATVKEILSRFSENNSARDGDVLNIIAEGENPVFAEGAMKYMQSKKAEDIKELLTQQFYDDEKDITHESVLQKMIRNNQVQNLDKVLGNLPDGLKVDDLTIEGVPLIVYAAKLGHADIVRTLINNGADVNSPDSDGNSAIQVALEEGIKNSKNFAKTDGFERAALAIAAQEGAIVSSVVDLAGEFSKGVIYSASKYNINDVVKARDEIFDGVEVEVNRAKISEFVNLERQSVLQKAGQNKDPEAYAKALVSYKNDKPFDIKIPKLGSLIGNEKQAETKFEQLMRREDYKGLKTLIQAHPEFLNADTKEARDSLNKLTTKIGDLVKSSSKEEVINGKINDILEVCDAAGMEVVDVPKYIQEVKGNPKYLDTLQAYEQKYSAPVKESDLDNIIDEAPVVSVETNEQDKNEKQTLTLEERFERLKNEPIVEKKNFDDELSELERRFENLKSDDPVSVANFDDAVNQPSSNLSDEAKEAIKKASDLADAMMGEKGDSSVSPQDLADKEAKLKRTHNL